MAHTDTLELITRTLQLKRHKREQEELLKELYSVVDDYNKFVKTMDKRLDDVVIKLEAILEDEHC